MRFVFKKLGTHWYLDVPHDDANDLRVDRKIERFLNHLDINRDGIVDQIYLYKTDIAENIIEFRDEDLLKYFTTNDVFTMIVYINNHRFKISSKLYHLIECYYHMDFHVNMYNVNIY